MWKSTDGASTWEKVGSVTASDGDKGIGIPIVLFDKASGSKGKPTPVIYTAVANNDGSLYRSTDAGVTWASIPRQPTGLMASHAVFDSTGALYVSYGDGPGPNDITTGAVWKYEAKAEKFTDITPDAPKGEDKFGYGGLSVDVAHPGTLMASTIDRWTKGDEVYRTTDGGKSWKALLPKAVRDDAGAKYLYWHKSEPIGRGWMGDIDIDPFNPGRAMYVTGAGIWATDDATAADSDKPTHWKFLDRGLEETVIKALVSPPAGPPLLSAMGDLCGFRHDDLSEPAKDGMFDNPLCGSASGIDIAWSKPEIVARVGWDNNQKWGATSLDGGKTWTPFKTMPKKGKGAGSIGQGLGRRLGLRLGAARRAARLLAGQGGDLGARRGAPRRGGLPRLGTGAVPARRRSREPQEVLCARRQGGAGLHQRGRRRPLHGVDDGVALTRRLPVRLRLGGGDARDRGRRVAHQLQRAQSLDRLGEDVRVDPQRERRPTKRSASASRPTGRSTRRCISSARSTTWSASSAPTTPAPPGCGSTTISTSTASRSVITGDPRVYGRVRVGTGGRGIIVYGEPK